MKPILIVLLALLTAIVAKAQSWNACSVWSLYVPTTTGDDRPALRIPDSHDKTSLVAFFTTTNASELLGDLSGATVSATVRLDTIGNPILWFGNDCHSGARFANVRPYFTTTTEPYILAKANAQETNYWWADYAVAKISDENWSVALPGTYTFTAPLDPAIWSDAQGHGGTDTNYWPAFYEAARHVAQIGFSFGGGCYFDVGVGIYNPDDPGSSALFTVLDYRILRPSLSMTYDSQQGVTLTVSNGMPDRIYAMQYSDDLCGWIDLDSPDDPSATNAPMRFYRIKPCGTF